MRKKLSPDDILGIRV